MKLYIEPVEACFTGEKCQIMIFFAVIPVAHVFIFFARFLLVILKLLSLDIKPD